MPKTHDNSASSMERHLTEPSCIHETKTTVIEDLLKKINQSRVLVIGDAMLDRYWYGHVERISPEAPVPIVAVTRSDERLGGAANVARNISAVGARSALVAVSGDDREADILQKLIDNAGIDGKLQRDKLINTTIKLRVISRNQQLIRIDFEPPPSKDLRDKMLEDYRKQLPQADAVVISDYGKGGLGYIIEMIADARKAGKPVLIDPKGDDYSAYRGATLITPNRREFELVAGNAGSDEELEQKAMDLVSALDLGGVLITRGEEGMSLFMAGSSPLHVPARAREVYDVTGAGDTVIALVASAFAARAEIKDAVELANIAAGIVVAKLGAATASRKEILAALSL